MGAPYTPPKKTNGCNQTPKIGWVGLMFSSFFQRGLFSGEPAVWVFSDLQGGRFLVERSQIPRFGAVQFFFQRLWKGFGHFGDENAQKMCTCRVCHRIFFPNMYGPPPSGPPGPSTTPKNRRGLSPCPRELVIQGRVFLGVFASALQGNPSSKNALDFRTQKSVYISPIGPEVLNFKVLKTKLLFFGPF